MHYYRPNLSYTLGDDGKWKVRQEIDELSIPDGTFENVIALLEKERKYYCEKYLEQAGELNAAYFLKAEANTGRLIKYDWDYIRSNLLVKFDKIELVYFCGREDSGCWKVMGFRSAVDAEILALNEQLEIDNKDNADRERKEYERLKAKLGQ